MSKKPVRAKVEQPQVRPMKPPPDQPYLKQPTPYAVKRREQRKLEKGKYDG